MAAEGPEVPSVDDVRRDAAAVLARFRGGKTRAFSIGDGVPEAVLLTYDEFEDLDGEAKFDRHPTVFGPEVIEAQLPEMLAAIRSGRFDPVAWGEGGKPEAVLMSTAQYRDLRGDDHPPPGVVDDPTQRTYDVQPMPDSKSFDLDEWAKDDPFTQQILDEIRAEEGLPRRDHSGNQVPTYEAKERVPAASRRMVVASRDRARSDAARTSHPAHSSRRAAAAVPSWRSRRLRDVGEMMTQLSDVLQVVEDLDGELTIYASTPWTRDSTLPTQYEAPATQLLADHVPAEQSIVPCGIALDAGLLRPAEDDCRRHRSTRSITLAENADPSKRVVCQAEVVVDAGGAPAAQVSHRVDEV